MGSEPNKEILQRVSQKVGAVSHVETVRPFSVNKPRSVEVTFDADIYPEEISQVYVDIELEFSGDFYIHYVEQWAGRQKECRWDRHKNTHNSRDHFHPFPAASTTDAEDREYPRDFFDVIAVVLDSIERRWGETFNEV